MFYYILFFDSHAKCKDLRVFHSQSSFSHYLDILPPDCQIINIGELDEFHFHSCF